MLADGEEKGKAEEGGGDGAHEGESGGGGHLPLLTAMVGTSSAQRSSRWWWTHEGEKEDAGVEEGSGGWSREALAARLQALVFISHGKKINDWDSL